MTFEKANILDQTNQARRAFSIGDAIKVAFELRFAPDCPRVRLAVELRSADGLPLANMIDVDFSFMLTPNSEDPIQLVTVTLEDIRLYPGTYHLGLWAGSLTSTEIFDYAPECLTFNIVDGGKLTMRRLPRSAGLFFFTPRWTS